MPSTHFWPPHTQVPIHTHRLPHNHNSGRQRTFSEGWYRWVVGTKVRLMAEAWAPSSCFLPFGIAHCGLFPKDPEAGTDHVCFSLSFSLLLTEAMALSQRDTQVSTAQQDDWNPGVPATADIQGPLPTKVVCHPCLEQWPASTIPCGSTHWLNKSIRGTQADCPVREGNGLLGHWNQAWGHAHTCTVKRCLTGLQACERAKGTPRCPLRPEHHVTAPGYIRWGEGVCDSYS